MKQLHRSYSAITFLIEQRGEFEEAFNAMIANYHFSRKYDEFSRDNNIYGLHLMPEVPFTVTFEVDSLNEHVYLDFVSPDDFMNKEPEAKTQLFEFRIRRTMLTSPYTIKETNYQIPARDIFDAHVQLGQTHHRDEEYDLEVLSWKKVN